ncbi:MAG: hypothetical protein ACT4PS_00560 [Betaproteobacteria bacterium]
MKKTFYALLVAAAFAFLPAAQSAELRVSENDTVESLLKAQKGRVTVRLRSGQELSGTVRAVTSKMLHLGALSGREFFDAAVPLASIEAVIVRTREQ